MIVNQQQFNASGTWFKPGGASFVDVILSGGTAAYAGTNPVGSSPGELLSQRYAAVDLPREVRIVVGAAGEDGYALIITHRE